MNYSEAKEMKAAFTAIGGFTDVKIGHHGFVQRVFGGDNSAVANADLVYVVVDASGEYLTADGGRTPAAAEAQEFDSREEAAAACERATDRVRSWPAE